MVTSEIDTNDGTAEVMVLSSDPVSPRHDPSLMRGRRGTLSSFDSDAERDLFSAPSRSSNIALTEGLKKVDTAESVSEWGAIRAQARDNNDREGMADLIDFLRTTSPPTQPAAQSVFDEDPEPRHEPQRWRLFKKLRRTRNRARSESPARRPMTATLPNSAVASKTSSGNSHIVISIPLDYSPMGADSDWALAIFNPTPPLPPSPPVRNGDAESKPYASDRTVTVLKTVSEQGSRSSLNSDNTPSPKSRKAKGSMSIWPKISPNPLSPPITPSTTPPGSLRGNPLSAPKKKDWMPLPPSSQYAELPASPIPVRQCPDDGLDKRFRLRSDSDVAQSSTRSQRKPSKQPQRRPENINLPPRRSSIQIVRPHTSSSQSVDGLVGESSTRQNSNSEDPQPSPGVHSKAPSLGMSISTTDVSEPVVLSTRSAKAYSDASMILQDSPFVTPRQSFAARPGSSDTTQTTLVNEPIASRNRSTRTISSTQSRKERVKSLKQRDLEAQKALAVQSQQDEEDGEITPRPRTSGTVASPLRLHSRSGTFGSNDNIMGHVVETKLSATNLANMAKSHETSSNQGSSAKISNWQATQRAAILGWDNAQEEQSPDGKFAQEISKSTWANKPPFRDITSTAASMTETFHSSVSRNSTSGSERSQRSQCRTSWASSVPLLNRAGSVASSGASVAQAEKAHGDDGQVSAPQRPARTLRPDSTTLSRLEAIRLASPRVTFVDSGQSQVEEKPKDTDESMAGMIAAFPKPRFGLQLSAIMPVAEVQPSVPAEEQESNTTLSSPLTAVNTSGYPPTSSQEPKQNLTQLDRPHTSRDDPRSLLTMSARELRSHYTAIRSARANGLEHEMLLNQERLELRLRQQEMNQMFFIERLERCMYELQTLPESPFPSSYPLDWHLRDGNLIDAEQPVSRDAWHEVRMRRRARLQNRTQQWPQRSELSRQTRRWTLDSSDESGILDEDYGILGKRDQRRFSGRRSSSSHPTTSSQRVTGGGGGSWRHADSQAPRRASRGGLDAMETLMRELQSASRVSQETNRTASTDMS